MSAKVSEITIDIDGNEIKLSIEQARELQKALKDVLGGEVRVVEHVEHHYPHYHPWWGISTYTANNAGGTYVRNTGYSTEIDTSGVRFTLTGESK